jgi:hypothetical protein
LDVQGMADHALKVKAYQQELNDQAAVATVLARHPVKPGQTVTERLTEVANELAGMRGTENIVGKITGILDAIKPHAAPRGGTKVVALGKESGVDPGMYLVSDDGTKVRLGPAPAKQYAPPRSGGAGQAKTMTPGEIRAAEQVVVALRNMRRLYQADPSAAATPWQTAAAEGLTHTPVFGGLLRGMTGPAGQKAMTKAQQDFQRNAVTLRHHYAMITPHTRMALGLLADINRSMVPPAGTDAATIASSYAPAWQETLSQIEPLLGPDWKPPEERGAPSPVPAPVGAPAGKPKPGYNPKFWKKP